MDIFHLVGLWKQAVMVEEASSFQLELLATATRVNFAFTGLGAESAAGGNVRVTVGSSYEGNGGDISMRSGASFATNGKGGSVVMQGGDGDGSLSSIATQSGGGDVSLLGGFDEVAAGFLTKEMVAQLL